MKLNETQINEIVTKVDEFVEAEYNLVYVPHQGKRHQLNAFFDFADDDECYLHISNNDLMEDEDDIKEAIESIFEEMGYNPKVEWDYDTGYEDLEHTLRIYL